MAETAQLARLRQAKVPDSLHPTWTTHGDISLLQFLHRVVNIEDIEVPIMIIDSHISSCSKPLLGDCDRLWMVCQAASLFCLTIDWFDMMNSMQHIEWICSVEAYRSSHWTNAAIVMACCASPNQWKRSSAMSSWEDYMGRSDVGETFRTDGKSMRHSIVVHNVFYVWMVSNGLQCFVWVKTVPLWQT